MQKACQLGIGVEKSKKRMQKSDGEEKVAACELEPGQKVPFEEGLLKQWFLEQGRSLPWRESPSAYAVWVSEVMLQQTQAGVVEGYFLRWMQRFPTLSSLAEASLEEVIKLWEGLGYYSRARNLHAAAKQIIERYGGEIPSSYEELLKIKGLGSYTAGAILSFAFKQKKAALDGNGIRVLSRYFAIEEDVQKSGVKNRLWELAEGILPSDRPWLVVEGLIELGALVCKKDPLCRKCPLNASCLGLQKGIHKQLPYKAKKRAITPLFRSVFVLMHEESVLLKRVERGKIMEGLYEFPYREGDVQAPAFSLEMTFLEELPLIQHHFTRFKVTLKTRVFQVYRNNMKNRESDKEAPRNSSLEDKNIVRRQSSSEEKNCGKKQVSSETDSSCCFGISDKKSFEGHEWVDLRELHRYPFPSGHRKIREKLCAFYTQRALLVGEDKRSGS